MKVTRLPGRNPAKQRSRPVGNKKDVPNVDTGPAVTIRIGSLIRAILGRCRQPCLRDINQGLAQLA
jgi:hypothetical protein